MYFPSKKDSWLAVVNWGCILVCFLPLFIGRDYIVLIFTIPLAVFLGWGWFTTGYAVRDEVLIIQSGPIRKQISIKDIKKITRTKSPLSSYALSLDRLEIIYDSGFGLALVSPKDQREFASLLKSINPQIELGSDLNENE